MITIDTTEADRRFFELLARCEAGETFALTKDGAVIAILRPTALHASADTASNSQSAPCWVVVTAGPGGPPKEAITQIVAALDLRPNSTSTNSYTTHSWNVALAPTERPPLQQLIARAAVSARLDINLIPDTPHRRKRLLVADMESTIIEQEMLDELGDFISKRPEIEDITARAMRGELDFEAALNARVSLLKGLDAGVLDDVAKRITLMPGAETLVRTMKANGAYCALVSGGFTVFTARVAERLGFDEHRANVLEIADGKLTGTVRRPILGREAKLAALQELTVKRGLEPEQTLAVGDGANDLAMLGAAGLGVAFRAKPKVREAAAAMPNGAVITHGDLTALLALQGYREEEHVEK